MQDSNNNAQILIKTLGSIIQKHRKEQGKTIYKISAEAELPKATWREIEIGKNNFRFITLWKIAEGLDIPLATLIDELTKELGEDFSLADIK